MVQFAIDWICAVADARAQSFAAGCLLTRDHLCWRCSVRSGTLWVCLHKIKSVSVPVCVFVCEHAIQQRTIRQQNEHFWRLQPGVVVVVLASICGNWAAQRVMVLPLCTTEHWTHWQMRRELVSAVGISHGRHYSTTSTLSLSLSLGQL